MHKNAGLAMRRQPLVSLAALVPAKTAGGLARSVWPHGRRVGGHCAEMNQHGLFANYLDAMKKSMILRLFFLKSRNGPIYSSKVSVVD